MFYMISFSNVFFCDVFLIGSNLLHNTFEVTQRSLALMCRDVPQTAALYRRVRSSPTVMMFCCCQLLCQRGVMFCCCQLPCQRGVMFCCCQLPCQRGVLFCCCQLPWQRGVAEAGAADGVCEGEGEDDTEQEL